jgi:hypothetical protein
MREYFRAAAQFSKILIVASFLLVGGAAELGYSMALILWAARL